MTVDWGSLSQEETITLDYIWNYDPGERDHYTLSEDKIEQVSEIISETEEKDDYSNQYTVLRIKDEYEENVEKLLEQEVSEIYPDNLQEEVVKLFDEHPDKIFQIFEEAERRDTPTLRLSVVSGDMTDILQDLQELGLGFRKEYLTTTDKTKQRFVFRTHPFNGKEKFLDIIEDILDKHLSDLQPVEIWAAYVSNYVTSKAEDNSGRFSSRNVRNALDSEVVESDESLAFLRERIKNMLRSEMNGLLKEDSEYISDLGFLKAVSSKRDNYREVKKEVVENIFESHKSDSDSVENSIAHFKSKGIILEEDNRYLLTSEFLEILEEIEERTKIESYSLDTISEAQSKLFGKLSKAEEEIKILDKFFDGKALRRLESVVSKEENIRIKILTSSKAAIFEEEADDDDVSLESALENVFNPRIYQFKKMTESDKKQIHDRFIIIDNKRVWQLGTSLNGAGEKLSTLFSHSERKTQDYMETFDDLWRNSESLNLEQEN